MMGPQMQLLAQNKSLVAGELPNSENLVALEEEQSEMPHKKRAAKTQ